MALTVLVAACGSGGEEKSEAPPKGTYELSNGRSLYIECRGSGSPTFVLEPGENTPGSAMSEVQKPLAQQSMTCVYDRANVGGQDRPSSKGGQAPLCQVTTEASRTESTLRVWGPDRIFFLPLFT